MTNRKGHTPEQRSRSTLTSTRPGASTANDPAYREPDKTNGEQTMPAPIGSVISGVPAALIEIPRLGRTLKQRADDALAFFNGPGTCNAPAEANNGQLEYIRGYISR